MKVENVSVKTIEFFKKNGRRIVCTGLVAGSLVIPFDEAITEEHDAEMYEVPHKQTQQFDEDFKTLATMTDKEFGDYVAEHAYKGDGSIEFTLPIVEERYDDYAPNIELDLKNIDGASNIQDTSENKNVKVTVSTSDDSVELDVSPKDNPQDVIDKSKDELFNLLKEKSSNVGQKDLIIVFRGLHKQVNNPETDSVYKTYVRKVYRLKLNSDYMNMNDEAEYEKLLQEIYNNGITNAFTILEETEEKVLIPVHTGKYSSIYDETDRERHGIGHVSLDVEGTDIHVYLDTSGGIVLSGSELKNLYSIGMCVVTAMPFLIGIVAKIHDRYF